MSVDLNRQDNSDIASYDAQKKYYDQYWAGRDNRLNQAELIRLCKIISALAALPRREGMKICDLGCGTGWLSAELTKFGKVTGVDLSPTGVELAHNRRPDLSFEAANILAWRPGLKFDVVVSSEVIEHVEDKAAFAATIEEILKPGGYLVLTTPNGRLKRQWDRAGAGAQLLELWVSPFQLRRLFRGKFAIEHHETFMFDYLYTGLLRWSSAPKLLRFLKRVRFLPIYDGIRTTVGVGLYQLLVARRL